MLSLTTENVENLYKNGIYTIKCSINNKFYIGSCRSSKDISRKKRGFYRRWQNHVSRLDLNNHPNPHLQHMWNKYGKETFSFHILEIIEDLDTIVQREQSYIDIYHKTDSCVNINKHATSTYQVKSDKKDAYKILSDLYKGKKRDRKIFESQCKPLLQYDYFGHFIQEHESIGMAAINTNTNRQDIHKTLRGKGFTANSYIWRYKTENYPLKIDSRDEMLINKKKIVDAKSGY